MQCKIIYCALINKFLLFYHEPLLLSDIHHYAENFVGSFQFVLR